MVGSDAGHAASATLVAHAIELSMTEIKQQDWTEVGDIVVQAPLVLVEA